VDVGEAGLTPYYQQDGVTIYHGDCREVSALWTASDVLVTNPPYPNSTGHFIESIAAAQDVFACAPVLHAIVFWHLLESPSVGDLKVVAKHVWHKSNTKIATNYEVAYELNDGLLRRASRVHTFPVIFDGLTGCYEATGHPTQKPLGLISRLCGLVSHSGRIVDPFMGSGTTLVAAKRLGRRAIGVESEERYCEMAALRLSQAVMFGDDAQVQGATSLTAATPNGQQQSIF
jgi:hypothetical protein